MQLRTRADAPQGLPLICGNGLPVHPRSPRPHAYRSFQRISDLRAPLLMVYSEGDGIVPLSQCKALSKAATNPKRMPVIPGVGYNDFSALAGAQVAEEITSWASRLAPGAP